MAGDYDVWDDIWPDRRKGKPLAPVGVSMDRRTGQLIMGWPQVEQQIEMAFSTRYHERVLRYWVGSFVPHILGRSATQQTITRFFWAIATTIELWVPNYRILYVRVMNKDGTDPGEVAPERLTSVEELRHGHVSFQLRGLYMPRGHLGDFTPAEQRNVVMIGQGNNIWRRHNG